MAAQAAKMALSCALGQSAILTITIFIRTLELRSTQKLRTYYIDIPLAAESLQTTILKSSRLGLDFIHSNKQMCLESRDVLEQQRYACP